MESNLNYYTIPNSNLFNVEFRFPKYYKGENNKFKNYLNGINIIEEKRNNFKNLKLMEKKDSSKFYLSFFHS